MTCHWQPKPAQVRSDVPEALTELRLRKGDSAGIPSFAATQDLRTQRKSLWTPFNCHQCSGMNHLSPFLHRWHYKVKGTHKAHTSGRGGYYLYFWQGWQLTHYCLFLTANSAERSCQQHISIIAFKENQYIMHFSKMMSLFQILATSHLHQCKTDGVRSRNSRTHVEKDTRYFYYFTSNSYNDDNVFLLWLFMYQYYTK